MYLFVYIFLLLSIMGLYTQLYVAQIARIDSQNKSAAEAMYVWHRAAYDLVKDTLNTVPNSLVPNDSDACRMTNQALAPAPTAIINPCSAVLVDPATILPGNPTYLPPGYNFTLIQWNTVLYNVGGIRYLVTYVDDTIGRLGFFANQIYRQMKNVGYPLSSYGWVVSGQLTTGQPLAPGVYLSVPTTVLVPAAKEFVPNGVLGFVSTVQ